MERLKPLNIWETSEYGGPDLKGTEDAIRFGMSAHEDSEACNSLLIQRKNLEKEYFDLNEIIDGYLDKKAEIAFKIQFTNDAIREVVRLLRVIQTTKDPKDLTESYCPFCFVRYKNHSDDGDCPMNLFGGLSM